ncbi:hypothetical protein A7985_06215 [Pseudoalteromonas luteoviolacea]|uniref:Uncharacterized protein n=1 Tax=Pseudoalteromonas luteoviolacea TaxID=43657 RepID=A0A1C0TW22_9GAMM|nr:hypothetical protein [Pseudoalteromonas luteoviolacea]OCQ23532.1 hypothetical protein A7985_06215 [Pseudoalteromonas luteoviolacea]
MKLKMLFVLLLLVVSSHALANANRFDLIGEIGEIRYHEASNTLAPSWKKHTWFTLKADPGQPKPSCYIHGGGYSITIPDGNDTAISMVLAAKMASKRVRITFDDTVDFPSPSYCKVQYITIL